MKVRMQVSVSGTRQGVDWPPAGSVIEVGDDEGASLCAGGLAVPVTQHSEAETATSPPAEERGPLTTKTGPGRAGRLRKG